MPKVSVHFTQETWDQLKKFIIDKYGVRKALSITVEEAVKAYLAREEVNKRRWKQCP